MANTPRIYALLAANSDYRQLREEDLPGCREDLALMRRALEKGLRVDPDNIRSLGEDGKVGRQSFARAIAEFGPLLVPEDTFIFYFSGHGRPNELLFSDGAVTIESIVTFIERLPARSRIVILDCCYSGGTNTTSVKMPAFEESLAAFAGRGIAVMASSAADRASWTGETGACSLYTQMAAAAILSRRTIRIIRENLGWAFLYNLIAIPVATGVLSGALGFVLNPMVAAAAMACSSVLVVSNSLRLLLPRK